MEIVDGLTESEPLLWLFVVCMALLAVVYVKHFTVISQIKRRSANVLGHLIIMTGFLGVSYLAILKVYHIPKMIIPQKQVSEYLPTLPANELLSKFNILGYSFVNLEIEADELENFNCDQVQFSKFLQLTAPVTVGLSVKPVRDQAKQLLKSGGYPILKWCFKDKKHESENKILDKKWMKFCGSSVWLSKYQVHFFVSRVVYSKDSHRNSPTLSLIYVEIFDKDWNEMKNYVIETSDNESITFPTIMKVDIDESPREKKGVMGPEDPRVILRRFKNKDGELEEEPVIIFNMRSSLIKWARAMHMYRPFSNTTVRLSLKNRKPRFREKNWAPFFDEADHKHIFFVYNFNPLRIVKCSLSKGVCVKVAGPDFVDSKADESKHVGALRGGTDIVPVPKSIIPNTFKDRDFWFGIARSHINQCGCLNEIYRPHSFIISKDRISGTFSLDYVSSLFDFNINPESWDVSKTRCEDGKSVLIPNSIAYWTSVGKEDFMGITFSEADRTNKLVHVKGFGAHINAILTNRLAANHYEKSDLEVENALLGKCSTVRAENYCDHSADIFEWWTV